MPLAIEDEPNDIYAVLNGILKRAEFGARQQELNLTRLTEHMIFMIRLLTTTFILTFISLSSLHAQSVTPAGPGSPLKAIDTPKPVYNAEWAKRGLTGKGIVLVAVDKDTGKVTGAQMVQSTGSKELDGSALEAYSRWRFAPGTVSQVKIPVEFRSRPAPQTSKPTLPKPAILYPLLIFLGVGAIVMATMRRRKSPR